MCIKIISASRIRNELLLLCSRIIFSFHSTELLVSIAGNKLFCLGVFTFCTCCEILICLVCFVASFKLSFV